MKILVISDNYPSPRNPGFGAFVYNLMQELSKKHDITVIAPFKLHRIFGKKESYGDEKCRVFRPKYISVSNKKLLGLQTGEISSYSYKRAVEKVLKSIPEKPDVIYAHFLSNAIPVLDYSKELNIPLVVASGESSYEYLKKKPQNIKSELIKYIKNLICVSQENKEELIEFGFEEDKITVIPNAVDYGKFKLLPKNRCKKKLGIDESKFVVGFIGHFIHRKGPNRVIEAIETLHDPEIQLVCVGGNGALKDNNFTKVIESVPNFKLPEIYNAFDIFVLPTLKEGHCNVIEEAKASCLPIISSKGTSVEEQIDETVGILVDPLSIDEIAQAISKLKSDELLRNSMVNALQNKRGENSIEKRAERITKLLKE